MSKSIQHLKKMIRHVNEDITNWHDRKKYGEDPKNWELSRLKKQKESLQEELKEKIEEAE